ncbi:hypothetical protein [Shewanella glacialipiscicola]|uniref:hypothetical protein n=1 Tax=Shewanella glacialipiscicola TaxID=614069 RepID=UPI003D7A9A7E
MKIIVAIVSLCLSMMLVGCFGPSLHEKLKDIDSSSLMKINQLTPAVIEEINCARGSEHRHNFVELMVSKFGIDAVRYVVVTKESKKALELVLLNDDLINAKSELNKKQVKIHDNLIEIESIKLRKNIMKEVKPVKYIVGHVIGVSEHSSGEVKGSYLRLLNDSENYEYAEYRKYIEKERDIECRVDATSSTCLSDLELESVLNEKRNSLGKMIFIKDMFYISDTLISNRVSSVVTLLNTAYDYNDTDSYVMPSNKLELYLAEEERGREREAQKRIYKNKNEDNLNAIIEIEKMNNLLLVDIEKIKVGIEILEMKISKVYH